MSTTAPRPRKRVNYSHATHRLREIERIILDRHGTVPDTDDADMYIMPAALCFRQLSIERGREPSSQHLQEQIGFWCKTWAAWYKPQMIRDLAHCLSKSRKTGIGKADELARQLRLADVDRTRLGIRTIGAYDLDKKARAKRRLAKKRERDRERARLKRAAKGAVSRAEYLAGSLSRAKPWEALGISRRTYERRRKSEMKAAA